MPPAPLPSRVKTVVTVSLLPPPLGVVPLRWTFVWVPGLAGPLACPPVTWTVTVAVALPLPLDTVAL